MPELCLGTSFGRNHAWRQSRKAPVRRSLLAGLRILTATCLRHTKVRAAILPRGDKLHHNIRPVNTNTASLRSSLRSDVRRAGIGVSEEAVVSCTEVAIRLRQLAAITLLPRSSRGRVAHAFPPQQRDTVIRGPAVIRRVSDVRLSTKVDSVLTSLDEDAGLLPWLIRHRDHADVRAGGDTVVVELAEAGRFVRDASHA
jgi:hypothetical protein